MLILPPCYCMSDSERLLKMFLKAPSSLSLSSAVENVSLCFMAKATRIVKKEKRKKFQLEKAPIHRESAWQNVPLLLLLLFAVYTLLGARTNKQFAWVNNAKDARERKKDRERQASITIRTGSDKGELHEVFWMRYGVNKSRNLSKGLVGVCEHSVLGKISSSLCLFKTLHFFSVHANLW